MIECVKYYSELLQDRRNLYITSSYVRKEKQTHVEEIAENEITNALTKMKNNKEKDAGDLPAELLKHAFTDSIK